MPRFEGVDGVVQSGLIFFDRKHVIGPFVLHEITRRFLLSVQRIGHDHAVGQCQRFDELAQLRNFVGLGGHLALSEGDALVREHGTEQMHL